MAAGRRLSGAHTRTGKGTAYGCHFRVREVVHDSSLHSCVTAQLPATSSSTTTSTIGAIATGVVIRLLAGQVRSTVAAKHGQGRHVWCGREQTGGKGGEGTGTVRGGLYRTAHHAEQSTVAPCYSDVLNTRQGV